MNEITKLLNEIIDFIHFECRAHEDTVYIFDPDADSSYEPGIKALTKAMRLKDLLKNVEIKND